MNAAVPSAPKLGTLPTPIMSPRNSLPTTPAATYLRSVSPLRTGEIASDTHEGLSIHSLLDIQGKLPLPGQVEDEDITISSALLSQATRSDSVDSISSVLNDTGHDTSILDEILESNPTSNLYMGNAVLLETYAPPLQALPSSVSIERALPILPAKHSSDPPLIPSLRRPDLMHLAEEVSVTQQRPVSPFSPTLPLYNEDSHSAIRTEFEERTQIPGREQDLINFDSDSESALPDIHDQYAHYTEVHGDSMYLAQNFSTSSFQQSGRESPSSSDEDGEEESYSSHALYQALSTSDSPYVRRAWEGSKLVLVPSRHTLPHAFLACPKHSNTTTSLEQPEPWERFTAVHALREEAGSPDQYVGYGETSDGMRVYARLDPESRQVQISLRQELTFATSPENTLNEFGMVVHPVTLPSSRHTPSLDTTSNQSSVIPPHLLISTPATSVESSNFPTTPPLSSDAASSISLKMPTGGTGSTPRMPDAIAFPSIEQAQSYSNTPLSPTRRLNILHEKVIYRKRRVRPAISASAPSGLFSPTPMTRNDSAMSNDSAAIAAQVSNIQQATDRLSKLSTPSMQSINSLASISTNNGKTVKKRDSKVRLRVPKWLGGRSRDSISGMKITESAPSTPVLGEQEGSQAPIEEEVQLVIEKVRLIQVDSYVVEWPGEESILSPTRRDFRRSLPLSARQPKQSLTGRMHRKSSQPLSSTSGISMQDATIKERRSFQHPSLSATLAEKPTDVSNITSLRMSSRHGSNASHSSRVSRRSSSALRMKHTSETSSVVGVVRDFSK